MTYIKFDNSWRERNPILVSIKPGIRNALTREGIDSDSKLVVASRDEIIGIPQIGKAALDHIFEAVLLHKNKLTH